MALFSLMYRGITSERSNSHEIREFKERGETFMNQQLFLDAAKAFRSLADVFEKIAGTYKATEVKVTLEDVRAVLAVKSRQGLTAEVKALIEKYGGSRLSDVKPEEYANLIQDAEELKNG